MVRNMYIGADTRIFGRFREDGVGSLDPQIVGQERTFWLIRV